MTTHKFLHYATTASTQLLSLLLVISLISIGCAKDSMSDFDLPEDTPSHTLEPTIQIGWTAFKFPVFEERFGVSGTFDSYDLTLQNTSEDILEKLNDAEISIPTNSVKVGDSELKTSNVSNYFFEHFTPTIHGKMKSINDTNATIEITINGITKDIPFSISSEKGKHKLTFRGKIENLSIFGTDTAFTKLNEACGTYHDGFVWPDIDLEIVIDNYDLL